MLSLSDLRYGRVRVLVVGMSLAGALAVPATAQHIVVSAEVTVPVMGPSGRPVQTVNDVLLLNGRVLVMEGETNSIQLLSLDGRRLGIRPNADGGGIKFVYPTRLAGDNSGNLVVLDSASQQVAHFRVGASSVELSTVSALKDFDSVGDVCSVREKLFVLGEISDSEVPHLIHVLDQQGRSGGGFGDGFGARSEMARRVFGAGTLVCDATSRRLVIASKLFPEVRAYDERGGKVWTYAIPNYRSISFTETASGVRYTYPENGWDATVSVFTVEPSIVAVQVGRREGKGANNPLRNIRTILISTGDGRILGEQTDLPLIKAAGSGRLVGVDDKGALRILTYTLRRD